MIENADIHFCCGEIKEFYPEMVEAANDKNIWVVGGGDFAGQFLDRIVDTDSPALITNYENKVKKLEEENIVLKEKIQNCWRPLESFDETIRTAAISLPFSLIGELEGGKKEMVRLVGFEPGVYGLEMVN